MKPTLTIFLPDKEKACGAAVVICPGGGYGILSMDFEGYEVAKWLNSLGVAGIVLKYRHGGSGYRHPAPLQDAQRAISMVRQRAEEWGVDPNRIGILGFLAGGHLASTAGTHFHWGRREGKDAIERMSNRPDFMILLYPVITMTEAYTHQGSRRNLLGNNPDEKLIENLSNEKQVNRQTPPTFLMHASDDREVPVENSIYFYLALRKAGVPAEMHIYEKGGHGFGFGREGESVSNWRVQCAEWVRGRGLLAKME